MKLLTVIALLMVMTSAKISDSFTTCLSTSPTTSCAAATGNDVCCAKFYKQNTSTWIASYCLSYTQRLIWADQFVDQDDILSTSTTAGVTTNTYQNYSWVCMEDKAMFI